jgi:hypothetical protein
MTGCEVTTPDACTWLEKFRPDAGFEERWTVGEKRQAVEHNENVERECR